MVGNTWRCIIFVNIKQMIFLLLPICQDLAARGFAHLSQALGTPPVAFGNVVEGRHQTKDVIAVITAVAQQQPVLSSPFATNKAHVLVYLRRHNIQHGTILQHGYMRFTGGLMCCKQTFQYKTIYLLYSKDVSFLIEFLRNLLDAHV